MKDQISKQIAALQANAIDISPMTVCKWTFDNGGGAEEIILPEGVTPTQHARRNNSDDPHSEEITARFLLNTLPSEYEENSSGDRWHIQYGYTDSGRVYSRKLWRPDAQHVRDNDGHEIDRRIGYGTPSQLHPAWTGWQRSGLSVSDL